MMVLNIYPWEVAILQVNTLLSSEERRVGNEC